MSRKINYRRKNLKEKKKVKITKTIIICHIFTRQQICKGDMEAMLQHTSTWYIVYQLKDERHQKKEKEKDLDKILNCIFLCILVQ